jgi:hypothetical protein
MSRSMIGIPLLSMFVNGSIYFVLAANRDEWIVFAVQDVW